MKEGKRRISITITEDEYLIFRDYAASQRIPLSTLFRKSVVAELRRRGTQPWYKKRIAENREFAKTFYSATGKNQVYFVLDEDADAIKIACSPDVQMSLFAMREFNPHKLRLLFAMRGFSDELIRRVFSSISLGKDWFRAVPELYDFIDTLRQESGSMMNYG